LATNWWEEKKELLINHSSSSSHTKDQLQVLVANGFLFAFFLSKVKLPSSPTNIEVFWEVSFKNSQLWLNTSKYNSL